MAIGFMSFGGMLTGGDEEETSEDNTVQVKSEIDKEEVKVLADNTTKENE